jgi:hypothetical protein
LTRLREFYVTGIPMTDSDGVLAEVEAALELGKKARRGFL